MIDAVCEKECERRDDSRIKTLNFVQRGLSSRAGALALNLIQCEYRVRARSNVDGCRRRARTSTQSPHLVLVAASSAARTPDCWMARQLRATNNVLAGDAVWSAACGGINNLLLPEQHLI